MGKPEILKSLYGAAARNAIQHWKKHRGAR